MSQHLVTLRRGALAAPLCARAPPEVVDVSALVPLWPVVWCSVHLLVSTSRISARASESFGRPLQGPLPRLGSTKQR